MKSLNGIGYLFALGLSLVFGAGLLMAASPITTAGEQRLCQYPNVQSEQECVDICALADPRSTAQYNPSTHCCNCLT